jgi:hypothetical protein
MSDFTTSCFRNVLCFGALDPIQTLFQAKGAHRNDTCECIRRRSVSRPQRHQPLHFKPLKVKGLAEQILLRGYRNRRLSQVCYRSPDSQAAGGLGTIVIDVKNTPLWIFRGRSFSLGVSVPAIMAWADPHCLGTRQLAGSQLLSLRFPGPYVFQEQAAALWGFRPLRIPIALLSAMILASTLTAG